MGWKAAQDSVEETSVSTTWALGTAEIVWFILKPTGSVEAASGPPEEEAAALPASASPRGLPGPKLTPDFRPDLDQRRRLSPLSCARWAMDSQGPDPNKAGPASGRTAGHPEGPLGQSLGTVTGPERSVRTGRSPPGRTSRTCRCGAPRWHQCAAEAQNHQPGPSPGRTATGNSGEHV